MFSQATLSYFSSSLISFSLVNTSILQCALMNISLPVILAVAGRPCNPAVRQIFAEHSDFWHQKKVALSSTSGLQKSTKKERKRRKGHSGLSGLSMPAWWLLKHRPVCSIIKVIWLTSADKEVSRPLYVFQVISQPMHFCILQIISVKRFRFLLWFQNLCMHASQAANKAFIQTMSSSERTKMGRESIYWLMHVRQTCLLQKQSHPDSLEIPTMQHSKDL